MFGIGAIVKAVVALVIVVMIGGGLWYVTNLKADLAISQANNEKLQDGIKDQQALMEQMRRDVAQIQQVNRELTEQASRYREEVTALSNKFSQDARGNPRDFGAFAAEKPDLIERLVNRGSRNAMRCVEIASGAPRTEAELAAKTSSDINRECPAIANPNYRAQQ